ncbi:ABC transporter ATP-binding protein [Archangium sp.]|uniref:ABC transporter ATP-binding protein n=1 Tax=Archangium sp. TaxID=1872627 RepID=UPI003899FE03
MAPRVAPGVYTRLLSYLRPYRAPLAIAILASAVTAATTSAYAWLVGPLLKAVLMGSPVVLGSVKLEGGGLLWQFPLVMVVVAGLKALSQFLHNGLMQSTGQRVLSDVRRDLYTRLLALPPSFFERHHSGELLSRFTSDVAQVEFSVTQALSSYVKDTLQVLALLGSCMLIDGRLFLLAFVVLPAAAFPVSRFAKSLKKVTVRTQGSLGQLTELTSEQLHNLPIVQAYGGVPLALERFDAEQERYLTAMRRSLFIRGAFTPTLEVLGVIGVALAIGFGARAVADEPELSGKLLSFLAAALLMYQPLKALSGTASMVVQGLGAAQRLFEIADEPAPPDEGREAAPLAHALRLEGVRVAYGQFEALRGVELTVRRGQRVALVGSSGAGKTTLFSVLLGFVPPSAGQVTWDGAPLEALKRSSVRERMAWVPQEPVLFSGSVRHNLLLGRPEADEAELWEALRRAHAEDFVRAFPAGLDEPVGERGARLSGGQRQRLAIARAFLRRPSLLLLDEPTSALDAASEREVQAGLAELMRGRTTLVIAHRLATVRDADRIYVLEQGAVVEHGTHDELVERRGRYAALLRQGEVDAA